MNAPKAPSAPKAASVKTVQGTGQSTVGSQQSAVASQGGSVKDNPELVLKPSKTHPEWKRWQRAYEEPETAEGKGQKVEEKEQKVEKIQVEKIQESSLREEQPAVNLGDRIAFQTKAQKGSIDFTFGKIQEESDTYYGILGDDGETYSLLKQQARPVNEVHRVIDAEQRQAKREGREPRTAESMRSREVKIKAGTGYQPGILTEKGELWQMVNVGNYVDYVKLGVLNENAIVGLKIGQMLGVTRQDGENDIVHRSDVVRVGEGVSGKALEKYMKKMESHLERLEKRITDLQLDNKSLREFAKKKAEKQGIDPKEQERLNKEVVRYKQKAEALQEKIKLMALRNAENERKRLEALSLTRKEKDEKKSRLETQNEKLKAEIEKIKEKESEKRKELEDQLAVNSQQLKFLEESRRQAKKEVATFQDDVAKYRKELEGVNREIENLKRQDYDFIFQHIQSAPRKKAKYDFSGIDFDSIDFQHALDLMYANLEGGLAEWRKKEAWDLIKNNKQAFFDRMLNYAKKNFPDDDDLTALQKVYGSNWMMEGALDAATLGRIKTIDEGDYSIYEQVMSDEEAEKSLEAKNKVAFDKTLKDLNIDTEKLQTLEKGNPLYEEFLSEVVKNICAEGATRAQVYQEMFGTAEGKRQTADVEKIHEIPPEAMYDPTEPWMPTELDYGAVDWHEDNYYESFQGLSDEEKLIYNNLPRDDEDRLAIDAESYYEDLTEEEAKEVQGILNTMYSEQNYNLTQDRVKQDMSEVLATAEIITDRHRAKASVRVKDEKEIGKMKETVAAKEKEFLDKYLYGIKKSGIGIRDLGFGDPLVMVSLFGQLFTIRKSQLGMFENVPYSMPGKARTVVTRQPLHHLEYSDKALLPLEQFKKRIEHKKKPVMFDPKDTKKAVLLFGQPVYFRKVAV